MILPKSEKYIEIPTGGWKEHTFYLVVAAVSPQNPMWSGILYTGFLNGEGGEPGGYAAVWHGGGYESFTAFQELHFLKIVRELDIPRLGHVSEEELGDL